MAITGLGNGIPHWDEAPDEWDRLVIGRNVMPGVWDVEFSCKRQVDVKKSKGKDGGRIKDEGYANPIIELNGKIATAEQWAKLQQILPTLHPKKKGSARETYGIAHPKTKLLGISTVYLTEIRAPQLSKGILSITITCVEFTPQPKAVTPNPKPPITGRNMLDQDKDITGIPDSLKAP